MGDKPNSGASSSKDSTSEKSRRSASETEFGRQVSLKAARRIEAEKNKDDTVWFGLGMMGIVGWSIVIPTLIGTAVGRWLDKNHPAGYSWTLTLLALGLVIGCINAWYWIQKEDRATHKNKGGNSR